MRLFETRKARKAHLESLKEKLAVARRERDKIEVLYMRLREQYKALKKNG